MSVVFLQGDAERLPFRDQSVDLVLGSPPYCDARTYGIDGQRGAREWVDWMLRVTAEAVRVSRGLVLWVCAGVTRDWCYWPACEGLLWEWQQKGGRCWRPAYWHRVGIPGSGGKQWLRADVEYVLAFTGCEKQIPWADNTANGHPPKWAPGGEMSYRVSDGTRVNQWGKTGNDTATSQEEGGKCVLGEGQRPSHRSLTRQELFGMTGSVASGPGGVPTKKMCRRNRDGTRQNDHLSFDEKVALGGKRHASCDASPQADGQALREQAYLPPVKANPGTLVQGITVGGGQMGHQLAHENEAPYPVKLAEWFLRGWCPEGGTVLDPFSGSGTTAHAAHNLGRHAIGLDLRPSQVELGQRRLASLEPTPEVLPLLDNYFENSEIPPS